jgi:excisionase family DNA binding protein
MYSINQTKESTGLGRSRIYEEIAAGRLRIVKSGRRTLVTVEALQAFVKLLEEQAGGAK